MKTFTNITLTSLLLIAMGIVVLQENTSDAGKILRMILVIAAFSLWTITPLAKSIYKSFNNYLNK